MNLQQFLFILLCCLLHCASFIRSDDNSLIFVDDGETGEEESNVAAPVQNAKIFQATNEWQEVGDAILPKGLHVRINLQTGKKEAKILDESEVDVHSRITSNYQVVEQPQPDASKIVANSAESLQKLNDLKTISKSNSAKYKNAEDIKQSKVAFTSESTLLKETFEKYTQERDEKSKLALLGDIEYYVHSIDLANDFLQFGGFKTLMQELNQTDSVNLKLSILGVFGASVQSNLGLKNELLKFDFLRKIIVLLNNSEEFPLLKRCLFVLSVFLRNFHLAQKLFFQSLNGIDLIELLLSKDLVLATKASALLSDLAIEISTASSIQADTKTVYERIQYESLIRGSQVCSKLVHLMHQPLDRSGLGTLFESMSGLVVPCRGEFQTNVHLLRDIAAQLERENDDFALVHLKELLAKLNVKEEL